MLSTPPAFILSQDQTLKKCVCSKFNINSLAYISLFTVLKDLSIVLWMCLSLQAVSFKEFSRIVYVFHCSVIKVLICPLSRDSLFTISQLFLFVNNFFIFFKSLTRFFDSSYRLSHLSLDVNSYFYFFSKQENGEGGIWTLAPRKRSIPLAGAPLQPLEYFS